ncbi:hypothetical protein Ade02nite_24770 [Paractinoplanes deccanensis]|uniref:AAA family ATPase n=1 Tax=Paractinoplanes deccanensis TaxID=113561 RepID=A0ABQ3Y1F2_9ACTN|nr:AAA domain-containing protein [Actinoplanes deccanensis]GID73836.1 hypothetical protein Ade02nite_24770 [Actinoplanes deccanensis]
MTARPVALAGPIPLVLSDRFLRDIGNQPTPFLAEIDLLVRQGGLPVTLETTRQGLRMAIHAAHRVAWLFPSGKNDALHLHKAAPRRFKDEDRLLAGALLLRCDQGFRAYPDLRSVGQAIAARNLSGAAIDVAALWEAWRAVTEPAAPAVVAPPRHARYLDLLTMMIDAGHRIETEKHAALAPLHYESVAPYRDRRYSARGLYRFRLTAAGDPAKDKVICLGDRPDLRGRVIAVEGRDVAVRFEPGTDFDQIKGQGTLRILLGDRVFRAQRDAVGQLRRGAALNPHLLDNLAGARFAPYRPAAEQPPIPLDPGDQTEAFQRALEVPDLLCVLGPPGTGKTRTITAVVRACAARGQRVLVTSHTHTAVDNVLQDLPPDLNVVRIGNEDKMSDRVKALSAESRVEAVRREILADSAQLDALTEVCRQRPVIDHTLTGMGAAVDRARSARHELGRIDAATAVAVDQVTAPLRAALDEAGRAVGRYRLWAEQYEAAAAGAAERLRTARAAAANGGPLALLHKWHARRLAGRVARHERDLAETRAGLTRAEAERDTVAARARAMVADDPRITELTGARAAAERTAAGAWAELARADELVRSVLRTVVDVPAVPASAIEPWVDHHRWCVDTVAMLDRRRELLRQWRSRIGDVSVRLEHEIARYAQVVGATCIGTDTSALIADLEFDLAIVDEAGQISTPNLLVPLVRSRRAMLVGDDRQLPPYLEDEVDRWAAGLTTGAELGPAEVPVVAGMLRKSGFELLFPRAGRANAVWLRTQRRMPAAVADFVSTTFYEGKLRTEHPGVTAGPVFTSPFAMVDTSRRPSAARAETDMGRTTGGTEHGYRNRLEASLIADLVGALRRHHRDWAVIVPFNAQKDLVIRRLEERLGAAPEIARSVGTVDSFQGGERDLIVFGFTRSNPGGRIGFLRELRRFNVAITRARRQLVLVGDLRTLRGTSDTAFREVMRSLTDHLGECGDLRSADEVSAALRALRKAES